MISVVVQRQPADKPGPDISDPLITSTTVAIERGRNEIDASCSPRQIVTVDIEPIAGLRVNRLVEIQDIEQVAWRGLVTNIDLREIRSGDQVNHSMQLTIEKEAE